MPVVPDINAIEQTKFEPRSAKIRIIRFRTKLRRMPTFIWRHDVGNYRIFCNFVALKPN